MNKTYSAAYFGSSGRSLEPYLPDNLIHLLYNLIYLLYKLIYLPDKQFYLHFHSMTERINTYDNG